jgi:hypothetical protein
MWVSHANARDTGIMRTCDVEVHPEARRAERVPFRLQASTGVDDIFPSILIIARWRQVRKAEGSQGSTTYRVIPVIHQLVCLANLAQPKGLVHN